MTVHSKSVAHKTGLPAGSLVHVGQQTNTPTQITEVTYSSAKFQQHIVSHTTALESVPAVGMQWLIVEGLSNVDVVKSIGHQFGLHELVLEDILNTHQRPKFEDHDDYLFLVLKMYKTQQKRFSILTEQISIVVFKQRVILFRECADDVFQPIKHRLQAKNSKIRSYGADYLAYVLFDFIIDRFFNLNEKIDIEIEEIEDQLLNKGPNNALLHQLQRLKKELTRARRYIAPLLALDLNLAQADTTLIYETTRLYIKDVSDHILRIAETNETHRELVSDLVALYMTMQSNKMNDVMKVLTLFSSIFIPLTFVTGIYGMNFDYMPELGWPWAYPSLLLLFVVISVGIGWFFRRRKWFE